MSDARRYARARGRYLAALGLGGLHAAFVTTGCAETTAPPVPAPAAESATAAPSAPAAPASAAPAPSPPAKQAAHHAAPWVPASQPEPVRRPGRALCPHGPFCVPQPASPGASPAPAPHDACAYSVSIPPGMGPSVSARTPSVT